MQMFLPSPLLLYSSTFDSTEEYTAFYQNWLVRGYVLVTVWLFPAVLCFLLNHIWQHAVDNAVLQAWIIISAIRICTIALLHVSPYCYNFSLHVCLLRVSQLLVAIWFIVEIMIWSLLAIIPSDIWFDTFVIICVDTGSIPIALSLMYVCRHHNVMKKFHSHLVRLLRADPPPIEITVLHGHDCFILNRVMYRDVLLAAKTKSTAYNVIDHGMCTICLIDFLPDTMISIVPRCTHLFHSHCLNEWLDHHKSCPYCREVIECNCSQADAVVQ